MTDRRANRRHRQPGLVFPGLTVMAMSLLGGCTEPYEQPYHWNATQVNQINLAAQVSDWHDLQRGHGDPGSDGQEAAAAVDRLRKGTVKALATNTVSDIAAGSAAPQGTSTPSSAAAAP